MCVRVHVCGTGREGEEERSMREAHERGKARRLMLRRRDAGREKEGEEGEADGGSDSQAGEDGCARESGEE